MRFNEKKTMKFILKLGKENNLLFSPCAISYLKSLPHSQIQHHLDKFPPNTKVTNQLLTANQKEDEKKIQNEYTVLPIQTNLREHVNPYASRYAFVKKNIEKITKEKLVMYTGKDLFEDGGNKALKYNLEWLSSKTKLVKGSFYVVNEKYKMIRYPPVHNIKQENENNEIISSGNMEILILGSLYLDEDGVFDKIKSVVSENENSMIKMVVIFGPFYKNTQQDIDLKELKKSLVDVSRAFTPFRNLKEIILIPDFGDPFTTCSGFYPLFSAAKDILNINKITYSNNPTKIAVHLNNSVENNIIFFKHNYFENKGKKKIKEIAKLILHNHHFLPEFGERIYKNLDVNFYLKKTPNAFIFKDDQIEGKTVNYKGCTFLCLDNFMKSGKYFLMDAYSNKIRRFSVEY